MSAIAETPIPDSSYASGRYSKRKRTQVNYCPSELDLSDVESDYEAPQTKKSRAQVSRPLPKRKIFPFLQLPAEIRNVIYTYALTDPQGINLVATFKHKRRTVERVDEVTQAQVTGYRSWSNSRINDSIRHQGQGLVALAPALLAVNKQIYNEARDILYSNEFIFADTFALYAFLINLGQEGSKHLKTLRLLGWGHGRALKAYNHAAFAMLSSATNVTTFYIDAYRYGWSRTAKSCAERLYRDGFPFFEAIGRARGQPNAAVEVLNIDVSAFQKTSWDGLQNHVSGGQDVYDQFKVLLSDLLCKQQERLMKPVTKKTSTTKAKKVNKKRKASADSDDEY